MIRKYTELIFKSILQNCEYLIKIELNLTKDHQVGSRFITSSRFKICNNRLTKNKNSTNIEKLKNGIGMIY